MKIGDLRIVVLSDKESVSVKVYFKGADLGGTVTKKQLRPQSVEYIRWIFPTTVSLSNRNILNICPIFPVSSGNSVLNENSIYIDYKAAFSVTNWSDDYIVRPYITLLDGNRQTLHYLGQSEQINLTAGRTDTNIPHIAESSSGIYSAPAKMIYAATDACGVLQYELFYTNGYSTETSCVLNRDGTYRDGSEGGNVTTELIGINRMFASIGDIMAVFAYENMTSFNLNQEREIQQSANLGGYEIGFTVNDSDPYGGVGLAVNDENEHIYLYSSKAASFTVTNAESAGVGYYSDDGWIEVRSANGTFALTDDESQNGYIIRVTLNK